MIIEIVFVVVVVVALCALMDKVMSGECSRKTKTETSTTPK